MQCTHIPTDYNRYGHAVMDLTWIRKEKEIKNCHEDNTVTAVQQTSETERVRAKAVNVQRRLLTKKPKKFTLIFSAIFP